MRLFITGTDTNIGKTVVAAWLVYHLKADYWKPIQTGTEEGYDSKTVVELANLSEKKLHPEIYKFKAPLSPHSAAALEYQTISFQQISIPMTKNTLIIEGAGGVLVPLNQKESMIDLIVQLQAPVIVVARSSLGTINHTCLTLEALRSRKILVLGVILNGPLNPSNKMATEQYGKTKVLAELPTLNPLTAESLASYPLSNNFHDQLKAFYDNHS